MRVIISAGGTGGHIYPALSIIHKIKEKEPDSEFLYIGTTDRMEKDIVPNLGIHYVGIKASGLSKNIVKLTKSLCYAYSGISKCKRLIRDFNPDIVIGVGGYVTTPVIIAAHKLHKKVVLHEQNSIPGKVNKVLSKYADAIFISMRSSAKYFEHKNIIFTGNPRSEDVLLETKASKNQYGLSLSKKLVLITTGSLGANTINSKIMGMLPKLKSKNYEVLLVTGKASYDEVSKYSLPSNVKITPYIEHMAGVLKFTDLIISRAGATIISEVTALGIPSIIIPSPYVANNHQYYNALEIKNNGGGEIIIEKDLTSDKLLSKINEVLLNRDVYLKMKENLKKMSMNNSSDLIYNKLKDLIK